MESPKLNVDVLIRIESGCKDVTDQVNNTPHLVLDSTRGFFYCDVSHEYMVSPPSLVLSFQGPSLDAESVEGGAA